MVHDRPIFALLVAMFLCAAPALAQRVSIESQSSQAFMNEPVRISLRIDDAERYAEPVVPTVDGLEIRRLAGEQSSTSVQIINGRTTQRRSVVISYEVVPLRTGRFEIPPFKVDIGGREFATRALPLSVVVSETGDLMLVSVSSDPEKLFVGQSGTLQLEIAVRRYRDSALGITLDESQLWSLLDPQSAFGVFGPALQKMGSENRRPRGESMVLGDTEYIVYTVVKPFDPITAGKPELGDIRIRMQYPTRLRRDNDIFFENRLSLAGSRPISATPGRIDVEVVDPPQEGRPASWTGAVGDFDISVGAKPSEVAVGDPITLSIRVSDRSGVASLEGLRPPMIAEQRAFAGEFRVPDDSASGSVEGRSKVFTQTIRALTDTVREIPPVEFEFFDPTRGEYRTVRSAPLAITVKPSAVAQIARDLPALGGTPTVEFTRVEGGIVANASLSECVARPTLGFAEVAATAAAPVLAAGLVLAARRLGTLRGGERSRRRRNARATAEAALAASRAPESVEAIILAFVAARCEVEPAGVTRKDAAELLTARGVDATLIAELDGILRECERARYLGGAVDAPRLSACIAALEQATERMPSRAAPHAEAGTT